MGGCGWLTVPVGNGGTGGGLNIASSHFCCSPRLLLITIITFRQSGSFSIHSLPYFIKQVSTIHHHHHYHDYYNHYFYYLYLNPLNKKEMTSCRWLIVPVGDGGTGGGLNIASSYFCCSPRLLLTTIVTFWQSGLFSIRSSPYFIKQVFIILLSDFFFASGFILSLYKQS